MEGIESMKFLADYGLAILVMGCVIYWLANIMGKKMEKNTESIDTLTHAITAMTQSMEGLYKTCERTFEDNRNTIKALLKHIEKTEGDE